MTEKQWLAATDPQTILDYHRMKKYSRRLRLLAVACVRLAVPPEDTFCTRALDVIERYADGSASRAEFLAVRKAARLSDLEVHPHAPLFDQFRGLTSDAMEGLTAAIEEARHRYGPGGRAVECGLIRCVFGNPFRPVTFNSGWRSETAVGLAAGIYDDRAFERLPILADALQEAGCEDETVLSHCREPGVHVRGCWAIDLVLGKS